MPVCLFVYVFFVVVFAVGVVVAFFHVSLRIKRFCFSLGHTKIDTRAVISGLT